VGALPFTGIKERIPKKAANPTIIATPPKIISAYLYLEKINLLFLTFCCRLVFFDIRGIYQFSIYVVNVRQIINAEQMMNRGKT
jgi:hypothetical protein